MNRPIMRTLTSLILALCAYSASADQVYRWVDEQGVVNYTQQKPRDMDAEQLSTRSGASRVVDEAPIPVVSQELSQDQQSMLEGLQAKEQARKEDIAKIKQENCEKSQAVLGRLTIKNRIRIRGDDGEYRIMAEDERQERIQEAQMGIAQNCVV